MQVTMIRDLIRSSAPRAGSRSGLHPSVARRALGVRAFGLTGAALDRFCPLPPELGPEEDFLPDPDNWRAYLARRERLTAGRALAEIESLRRAARAIRARGGDVTVSALADAVGRPRKTLSNALAWGRLAAYRVELIDSTGEAS